MTIDLRNPIHGVISVSFFYIQDLVQNCEEQHSAKLNKTAFPMLILVEFVRNGNFTNNSMAPSPVEFSK